MFSRIAATSGKTALLAAGSAIGGASGATYLLSSTNADEAAVAAAVWWAILYAGCSAARAR